MAKMIVNFNEKGTADLPNNKTVVFRILNKKDENVFTGIAKKGKVHAQIMEHKGKVPGAKVQVEQVANVAEATKKQANIVKRSKPKYNLMPKK